MGAMPTLAVGMLANSSAILMPTASGLLIYSGGYIP